MEREEEIMGGFVMNRFWPLPFNIFINNSYMYLVAVIAILGYGDYALTNYPKKIHSNSWTIVHICILLLLLSRLSIDTIYLNILQLFCP